MNDVGLNVENSLYITQEKNFINKVFLYYHFFSVKG